MSKRPKPTWEPLCFGLEVGEATRAKLLVLRGEGVIHYQGFEIMNHPHHEFVVTHREGGGVYATSDVIGRCNCPAGMRGKECCHVLAVRFSGGIRAIKRAFEWHESRKGYNEDK